MSEARVFDTLGEYRARDTDFRAGKTWGYVFDAGREIEAVGKRAYMAFLSENALDPTIYPSLLRLENEVVGIALDHVRAPAGAAGSFTSGGTESIILAVKAARDAFRAAHPEIAEPELVLPVTAHAAFHKAAHYLGVRVVPIPVDPKSLCADVAAASNAMNERTMLLVGSAPSYAHGVIDPISDLAALAHERGVLFHVDACIGGFLLPYFRRLGHDVPDFDFSIPGVTSLSLDLHKYAYCPKGASVVLFREKALRRHAIFACSRWSGYTMVNTTIQSTKSGGPLAAAWAVLHFVGDSGYVELAQKLREAMQELVSGIAKIPELSIIGSPRMTLIACNSDALDVFVLADEMKALGWYIQPQLGYGGGGPSFHLSLQPGNIPHVSQFLNDLKTALERAKAVPKSDSSRAVADAFASVDPASLTPELFQELLKMGGMSGVGLPDKTSEINQILAVIPPELSERLLAEFVNELFSAAR